MQSPFIRQVAVLVTGTSGAHLLQLASLPVLSRLFAPADIGVVSIFLAFVAIWAKLGSLRFESAILIVDDESITLLVMLCLTLVLCTASLSGLAIATLTDIGLFGFGDFPEWVPVLGIPVVLGVGLFSVLRAWALRNGLVRGIRNATLLRAVGGVSVRVGGGLLGFGTASLFVAELIAAWTSLYGLAVRFVTGLSKGAFHGGRDTIGSLCLRYKKFPLLELPSVLIDTIALWLPIPLVAQFFGPHAAGVYALSHRLVALPAGQISSAVADVFHMRMAAHVREAEYDRARKLVRTLLSRLAIGGLAPCIALMVGAPLIMDELLGAQWSEVGLLVVVIAPWIYCSFVVSTLSRLLLVLSRQELKLIYDITALVGVGISFAIGVHFDLSLPAVIGVLAAANAAAYAVYLSILVYAVRGMPSGSV